MSYEQSKYEQSKLNTVPNFDLYPYGKMRQFTSKFRSNQWYPIIAQKGQWRKYPVDLGIA